MKLTRREGTRLIILGGLSVVVTLGAVRQGRDILKAISNRSYRYTTGLDFSSYEPDIQINGERVETTLRWQNNTRAGDITKWSTVMMARMIAFNPYRGRYAYREALSADADQSTFIPTLETIIAEGNKTISALSYALDREVGGRQLIVNPRMEQGDYLPAIWQAAIAAGDDPVRYFITHSFESAIAPHQEKNNLLFELDKPKGMSFDDYNQNIHTLVSLKESYNSNLPLIVGVNATDTKNPQFPEYFKQRYSKEAEAILINIEPDWSTLDYPSLEQDLMAIRKIVGSHKLYVRLSMSVYEKSQEQLAVLSSNTLEQALSILQQYADGHFINDDYGLYLYRGIFGEDIMPPLDNGELKRAVRRWHHDHIEA